MTEREALKLALDALEVCEQSNYGRNWVWPDTAHPTAMKNVREAITAIKEALAQPEQDGECKYCTDGCPACDARKLTEQKPVAWAKFSAKGNIIDLLSEPDDDYTPLYTTPPQGIYYTPPQRKPLTD